MKIDKGRVFKLEPAGFRAANGDLCKTIRTELIEEERALSKQDNSLNEYRKTHEEEALAPNIRYLMRCFQYFIGHHIPSLHPTEGIATLLDVGCGIGLRIPLYLREIAVQRRAAYIGLDPFPVNPNRDFFFINGRLEGLHKFLGNKFDCAIFSTSLDHFQDLEAVTAEIHKIIKPDGVAIFWVGLHDPDVVAEQEMSESWRGFPILSWTKVLRRAGLFPISILRMFLAMRRRQRMLSRGEALDNLHFHYFTAHSLQRYMETVGEIIDCQRVEKTNSVFYALRIRRGSK